MKETKTKQEQKTNKTEELIKQIITSTADTIIARELRNLVSIPDELDRRKVDKIIKAQDSLNVHYSTEYLKLTYLNQATNSLSGLNFATAQVAFTTTMITSPFCFYLL